MKLFKRFVIVCMVVLVSGCASAPQSDGVHHLVIQVSTDDPRTQTIALNNAVNAQKAYEPGMVEVEIVAYGPGLSLLTTKSKQAKRVSSLAMYDEITFSACNNTMKKIEKKKGKKPVLVEGVEVVPAGVTRIMELQEEGYSYLRP